MVIRVVYLMISLVVCTVFVSLYDVSMLKCDCNVSVVITVSCVCLCLCQFMVIARVLLAH